MAINHHTITNPDGSKRFIASSTVFGYSSADDGNIDAVVNFEPQRLNNATFDGWHVTAGPYEFRLGKPLLGDLINKDGVIAMGWRGSWIGSNLQRFIWIDQDTLAITPIGNAANYNRANLDTETITIESIPVQSISTWSNIFPNCDLKIYAEGKQLKTELYARQSARNAASAAAPATGNLYLAALYQLDLINVPRAVKNGQLQNLLDFDDEGQHTIEWRNALNAFIAYMPIDKCWVENADGTRPKVFDPETGQNTEVDSREYPLRKRIFQSGGKLYLAVGISKAVFDSLPIGTLVFDPTFSNQPAEADAADAYFQGGTSGFNTGTATTLESRRPGSSSFRTFAIRDDSFSTIPTTATVTAATLYLTSADTDSARTIEFYRLLVDWVESQADVDIRKTSVNWNTTGGRGVGSDINGTNLGSMVLSASANVETSVSLNTTEFQNLISGTNNGLLSIMADDEASVTRELHSSNASTASYRPRWSITYTITYTMTMGQGSFTATGQNVAITSNRQLTAAQGSYTQTGQAVNLTTNRVATLAQGSYALSGQSINLARRYPLALEQGSYALSGQALSLIANRSLAISQGGYALTGQAVNLLARRLLALVQGSYSLAGQSVGLTATRSLALEQGSYALAGQALTLAASRLLTAAQGSYALTGQSVALLARRLLTLVQGSYAVGGQSVTLTYNGTAYALSLDLGSYALTGQTVSLLTTRLLTAAQGGYTLTGQDVASTISRALALAQGSYTLSGQALAFTISRSLTPAQGSYTLTGRNVALLARRLLVLAPGSYVLTGQSVTFTYSADTPAVGLVTLTFSILSPVAAFTAVQPAATFTAKQASAAFDLN